MARRRRQEISYNVLDLQPNVAIGIKLPFSNNQSGLFDLSYSTEEQAISNLKNLLLTRKGERVMQPNFGTNIYDSLFENNVDELPIILRDGISADIAFWLPRCTAIICGHDWNKRSWPGVCQAITEAFGKPHRTFADTSWLIHVTKNA